MKRLLLPLAAAGSLHAATSGDAIVSPEQQGVLIDRFFKDFKNSSNPSLSTSAAVDLFVTDGHNGVRTPIYGTDARPAHPGPGVVDGSLYDGHVDTILAAKSVRPDLVVFASKKLDGDTSFPAWCKDGNGVIPAQYAILLADYLEHMASRGIAVEVLGIDNEREFNEGNITPSRHKDTIDALLPLLAARGLPVPKFIGPEAYGPDKNSWMANLMTNGWGDRLDIYGTHYYPQWRPISGLQSDLAHAGSREKWHTELHWDNSEDVLAAAEEALVTMWDCTDNGMNGLMWWAYARTGLRGSMMRHFSTPLAGARPVPMDDVDGPGTFTLGKLQTRAFRRGNELTICALNLKPATAFPDQRFVLDAGAIGGNVQWRQWTDAGPDAGNTGTIIPATSDSFLLTLPARSLTVFTVTYVPDPPVAWYRFENDGTDSSGNGNDGAFAGDTSFVSGRSGFAAAFDGSGDHIVVPRSVSETFSIDFWMKTTTPGTGTSQWYQGTGLVDAEVAGATTDFGVALIGGRVVFGIGQPDTTIFSSTDVTDGRWHHVAAQRNAVTGEFSLHIDGRLEASGTASTAARTAPPAIRIGGRQTGGNAFNGRLDEVRIHDRLLIDSDFPDHHLPTVTVTAIGNPSEQGPVPGSFRIAREPGISPYPFIDAVEDNGTWLQGNDGSGGSRSMTVSRPTDSQLRPNDGGTYFSATTGVWYRGVAAPQLGSLVVEPGTYTVSFHVGDNDPDMAFYSTEKNPIGGNHVGLTAAPDILPALNNTTEALLQTLDPSISLSASVSAVPETGEWVQWTLTYTVPENSPLIGRPLGFVFRKPNTTSPETNGCFDGPFVIDFTPSHPSGLVYGGDLVVPLLDGGTADGTDFLQPPPTSVTIPAGQESVTIDLTPVSDLEDDPDETVVSVPAPDASYFVGGGPATLQIADHPMDAWRADVFGSNATDPAIAGNDANPDGDRFPNWAEFALLLDPLRTDAPLVQTPSGEDFLLRYDRRGGADTRVTASVDLKHWDTDGIVENVVDVDGERETVEAAVPKGATRKFARIEVSR